MKTTEQCFDERAINGAYQKYTDSKIDKRCLKIIRDLEPNKVVLSLGCGAGREVAELLKHGHKVTAIDVSGEMIQRSILTNPKANHYCMDCIEFAQMFNHLKFDYIIGLFSFLNYIKKEDRKELIKNLYGMLNEGGRIMIFELRRVTDRWQDVLKVIYYYWLSGLEYEFGDIPQHHNINHHYTKKQLKKLFEGFNWKFIGENVVVVMKGGKNGNNL